MDVVPNVTSWAFDPRGYMLLTGAVEEFSISRSTLYRLAQDGRLRIFGRTGDNRSYVNRSEVAALSEFKPKNLQRKRKPKQRKATT